MRIEGFELDEGNKTKNWEKHRVSVKECEETFLNAPRVIYLDQKHTTFEKRYIILGHTNQGRPLQIVYTIRTGIIRVISARDQSRKERMLYENETEKN